MPVWDNQQETNWFSGILEAEGCASGNSITISNTDKSIIEVSKSYLNRIQIDYSLGERKLPSNKTLFTISINGRYSCQMLITHLDICNSFQCRREEFTEKLNLKTDEIRECQFGSSTTTRRETLTEKIVTPNLHWLIGIFEGEGSIGLYRVRNEDRFLPQIRFVNTNQLIIEKYFKTLHNNQLAWHVHERKPDVRSINYATNINVCGFLRCQRFLIKTQGLWRSSVYNYRANELLKFINSRLAVAQNSPTTPEQMQMYWNLYSR